MPVISPAPQTTSPHTLAASPSIGPSRPNGRPITQMSHTPTSPHTLMVVVVLPPVGSPIQLTDILIILTFSRPRTGRNPPLSEGGGTPSPESPFPAPSARGYAVCVSPWARNQVSVYGNSGLARGHGSISCFLLRG